MGEGVVPFSRAIVRASSPAQAMEAAMRAAAEVASARASGVYLLTPAGLEIRTSGVTERDLDRYLSCRESTGDPLLKHLVMEHTAIHDQMLYDLASWQRTPLYDVAVAPAGLCHYALAPILSGDTLLGALTVGRDTGEPPFETTELLRLGTLASYLGSRMLAADEPFVGKLSPRQQEVAMLVAKGLKNAEAAQLMGVSIDYVKKLLKQVFRAMEVTTRAELAGVVTRSSMIER